MSDAVLTPSIYHGPELLPAMGKVMQPHFIEAGPKIISKVFVYFGESSLTLDYEELWSLDQLITGSQNYDHVQPELCISSTVLMGQNVQTFLNRELPCLCPSNNLAFHLTRFKTPATIGKLAMFKKSLMLTHKSGACVRQVFRTINEFFIKKFCGINHNVILPRVIWELYKPKYIISVNFHLKLFL